MSTGLYVSVPFCRTKCSYCNFASGVFSPAVFEQYVRRVCLDIERVSEVADQAGGMIERDVDSIYLGGGTPTLLDIDQLRRIFVTTSQNFSLRSDAEITAECAPGTLSAGMIEGLLACGVNRVSLGVQSFTDREVAAVGRLHKASTVAEEITRLQGAGLVNINVDLIAGLPYQTAASWDVSLEQAIACGAPHVSVYMLEVDEDSRLGRELIAGGTKYHAHHVPDDDLTADLYLAAGERLQTQGIPQYEISNFARAGCESRHNLKYWTRQPYLGFGVDAHSMLRANGGPEQCVRMATADSLDAFVAGTPPSVTAISKAMALEEAFFLGLRLNRGVDLGKLQHEFGGEAVATFAPAISESMSDGLLQKHGECLQLTERGRLLSNEVFEQFISNSLPAAVET